MVFNQFSRFTPLNNEMEGSSPTSLRILALISSGMLSKTTMPTIKFSAGRSGVKLMSFLEEPQALSNRMSNRMLNAIKRWHLIGIGFKQQLHLYTNKRLGLHS